MSFLDVLIFDHVNKKNSSVLVALEITTNNHYITSVPQQPNPDQSHQTHDQRIALTRGSGKKLNRMKKEKESAKELFLRESMKEKQITEENIRFMLFAHYKIFKSVRKSGWYFILLLF